MQQVSTTSKMICKQALIDNTSILQISVLKSQLDSKSKLQEDPYDILNQTSNNAE